MPISISCLGKHGRFANQIFQYAFAKIYAKKHSLTLQVPAWDGQILFDNNDPPIMDKLLAFHEKTSILEKAVIPNLPYVLNDVDLVGFFQYHTSYYAPNQAYFRSLFQPIETFQVPLHKTLENLHKYGKTVIGIHIRKGDFGWGTFWEAPVSWYTKFLDGFWETLSEPVLFIASDEPDKVKSAFKKYNPIVLKDVISVPQYYDQIGFYFDFWLLSQCDYLAISNSSFSFAASMLNESAKAFFRPHFRTKKLIPYDPWNSDTRLRGTISPGAFCDLYPNQDIASELIWKELRRIKILDANGYISAKFKANPLQTLNLADKFHKAELVIRQRLQWLLERFGLEI